MVGTPRVPAPSTSTIPSTALVNDYMTCHIEGRGKSLSDKPVFPTNSLSLSKHAITAKNLKLTVSGACLLLQMDLTWHGAAQNVLKAFNNLMQQHVIVIVSW